jgi:hypothetical protein
VFASLRARPTGGSEPPPAPAAAAPPQARGGAQPPASAPQAAAAQRSAPAAAPAAAADDPSAAPAAGAAPKWVRTRQSGWASDGSRTIAFELKAEREVPVWMRRVRPTLALRCLGREIEMFVVTDWPASPEETPDSHTVKIALDAAAGVSERWEASVDKQTLFAPNGAAFARKLTGAKALHFGFTPFNAPPVSVDFDVTGIDKLLPVAAKTCGRRI